MVILMIMGKALRLAASLGLVAAGCVQAQTGATAPRSVAQCVMCHGVLGLSVTPDAPHLANQPRIYLVAQLKAFRNGSRQHAVMNVIAKPLTDDDIDAAADWFNKVAIETIKP